MRSRSKASLGTLGTPARWLRTWATVIACLPWRAYSGMYSHTRSPRWMRPRSSSRWATIAVTALAAEKMTNGVSGATATLTSSSPSSGPLPLAWPMARSSTTRPSRRRHSWIAGCTPLRYSCSAASQIVSIWSRLIPASWGSASSPIAVIALRSRGTSMRRSGSGPSGGRGTGTVRRTAGIIAVSSAAGDRHGQGVPHRDQDRQAGEDGPGLLRLVHGDEDRHHADEQRAAHQRAARGRQQREGDERERRRHPERSRERPDRAGAAVLAGAVEREEQRPDDEQARGERRQEDRHEEAHAHG